MKCFSIAIFSAVFSLSLFTFHVGAKEQNTNSLANDLSSLSLLNSVKENKKAIAQALARDYTNIEASIRESFNEYRLSIPVNELIGLSLSTVRVIGHSSVNINRLKGIEQQLKQSPESIILLRLADDSMLAQLHGGQLPLFTFATSNDDGNIEAFAIDGEMTYLDAYSMPTQPVFIIELNKEKTMKAGLKAMNAVFDQFDDQFEQGLVKPLVNQPRSELIEPLSMTVIKNIEVQEIKESWISGPAEVYAIITGVNALSDELMPKIEVVELPYLDKAQKEYTPNQIIVHWDNYRWQAVDILLMESDDNVNYKALATVLLEVTAQVLQFIPEVGAQTVALITRLTNAVIQAMPDTLMTNEDDFIDVFYTIFEGESYSEHHGASQNAKMTLEPLLIQPRR
ncbi:DUF3103 family protein [uncultured Shewanella sp.]|uniref:DUF3103 family protein n=1 Tax=uncultured Shewanella sp. TaxID=173975 RepID=UPI00260B4484|nr:DUF3103 family protein [uncultured Shewanella sp.]